MIPMVVLIVSTLYACANTASIVKTHPEKVTGMPDCRECHTDTWQAFNHKAADFFPKHRFYAQEQRLACAACHEESFCSDCHAHKEEIKPSDKFADSPERTLPHRGDYLSQHKIDGRINPASCVKCHGRQNNERCATCHR
ncbi:cytochrome C [Oryzomonas rubra]|nr:cytochrome C [Oryzomonas rubra]